MGSGTRVSGPAARAVTVAVWLGLAFVAGVRWVGDPGLLSDVVVPGAAAEAAPRGRVVLLVRAADCAGRLDAMASWARRVGGDSLTIHGVVVDPVLPDAVLDDLRASGPGFPLERRGWQAATRAARRLGYTRTPLALRFDGAGRLVEVTPSDALSTFRRPGAVAPAALNLDPREGS